MRSFSVITVDTGLLRFEMHDLSANLLQLSEEGIDSRGKFALPENSRFPAKALKFRNGFAIASYVSSDLGQPVFPVGCGNPVTPFAMMPVPEAAMHKDRNSVFRKDEIRFSGQIVSVKPEPVPAGMQRFPDRDLWFRVM